MNYRDLWDKLLRFFFDTEQTNWGKNQIVNKMMELELEEEKRDNKKGESIDED